MLHTFNYTWVISLTFFFFIKPVVAQEAVSVEGHLIKNVFWADKVYLLAIDKLQDLMNGSDALIIDSALVSNEGKFHFTNAKISSTKKIYRLNFLAKNSNVKGGITKLGKETNFIFLSLDNKSKIKLHANMENLVETYTIDNDAENQEIADLNKLLNEQREMENAINTENKINQTRTQNHKDSIFQINKRKYFGLIKRNIKKFQKFTSNAKYINTLLIACFYQGFPQMGFSPIEYFEHIEKQVTNQKSIYANDFSKMLEKMKNKGVFKAQMTFRLMNIQKDTVDIFNLKNKYNIFVFWASWCKPCRVENRTTLPKIQKKYKQDIGIVSVSIEEDMEKWQKAHHQDKINWNSYIDLTKMSNSLIADYYSIDKFPTILIFDENKNLIAFDVDIDELEKFLDDKLKK